MPIRGCEVHRDVEVEINVQVLQTGTRIIGCRRARASVREEGKRFGSGGGDLRGDRAHLLRAPHSKNPAGLLAVAFVASCCHMKEDWTTFVSDAVRAAVRLSPCGRALEGELEGDRPTSCRLERKAVARPQWMTYGWEWTQI